MSMASRSYNFELFADYFQIYLMDVESNDDTSEIWTEKALKLKLGIMKNSIAIGTFRNVDVPIEIEVLKTNPDLDLNDWDHVSIGYFKIESGQCAVYGCTDYFPDAKKIELAPGNYSAISLAKGLDSITNESKDADDYYKIILWPSIMKLHEAYKIYENT